MKSKQTKSGKNGTKREEQSMSDWWMSRPDKEMKFLYVLSQVIDGLEARKHIEIRLKQGKICVEYVEVRPGALVVADVASFPKAEFFAEGMTEAEVDAWFAKLTASEQKVALGLGKALRPLRTKWRWN